MKWVRGSAVAVLLLAGLLTLGAATSNPSQIWVRKNVTGSIVATLAQWFDWSPVTPQMFGAKGDSSTDDTSSIQKAITFVSASGGVVFFPAGTYRISSTLSVGSNNVQLRGAGRGVSIIKQLNAMPCGAAMSLTPFAAPAACGAIAFFQASPSSSTPMDDIGIFDLTISDGNSGPTYSVIGAPSVSGGFTPTSLNSYAILLAPKNPGILINAFVNRFVMEGVEIDGFDWGLRSLYGDNNTPTMNDSKILNSFVYGTAPSSLVDSIGININGQNTIVSNNHVSAYTLGINLTWGAKNNVVNGNYVWIPPNGGDVNIYVASADHTVISNNNMKAITPINALSDACVKAGAAGSNVANGVTITGNNCTGGGYKISHCADSVIENNTSNTSGQYGVWLDTAAGTCPRLAIKGNTVVSATNDGIVISPADHAEIEGNTVTSSGGTTGYGIRVVTSTNGLMISNNIVKDSPTGGTNPSVYINAAERGSISGNQIMRSSAAGTGNLAAIFANNTANRLSVMGNTCYQTGRCVVLATAISDCVVVGNMATTMFDYGVYVDVVNAHCYVAGNGTQGTPSGNFVAAGNVYVNHDTGMMSVLGSSLAVARVALTYGASIATDASLANSFTVTATNGTAFAFANPTNLIAGQRLLYTIRNTSGGALGATTWGATFKVAAPTALTIATGNSLSIEFSYDGTNLIEVFRTPVVVPN